MKLLLLVAGVVVWGTVNGQAPVFHGTYEELKPEQKRLVDDWLERFSKVTGSHISPKEAYSDAAVSTRTTFEAVTHALMTTHLTDEGGQALGPALDVVSKVDDVAGKLEGAGGDEQFRIYVQLKPDAYDTLMKSREFKRTVDNTTYHRGFPICFRSLGVPSIQVSMSRDRKHADIDVDYRSPKIPAMVVNGHLSSSNSDVQAGNNYNKHVEKWQGLGDWWKNFFGMPLRMKDTGERPRGETEEPPDVKKGNVEESMDDFLKRWLIDQRPSEAMAYVSPRCFSCLMSGEKEADLDRGMARYRMVRGMQQVNALVGKVSSVTEVVQPVSVDFRRIRNTKEPAGKGYTLFEVREDAAAEAECDYRYGVVDPPKKVTEKFGDYYGTAFRIVSGKTKGSTAYLLWTKEHGAWRIVTYVVDPPGKQSLAAAPVQRAREEAPKVAGNAEMLKANKAFLTAWLEKGDTQGAMGFLAESCLSCVGLYAEEGPKKAATPEEARTRLASVMSKLRSGIGSGNKLAGYLAPAEITTSMMQVVTHPDEKTFTVIGLPDTVMEAVDCTKRSSPQLLPVKEKSLTYGNYYATVVQPKEGAGGTLYLVWAKEGGGWKIVAYHLDVP